MSSSHRIGVTLVDGRPMEIWNRSPLSHQLGKMNGQPATWWLKHIGLDGSVAWIPWIDLGTKRPCFSVSVEEQNYTKEKWDELQIRSSVSCTISVNSKSVYQFASNSITYSLAKAQTLIVELSEHPSNFIHESLIGRKVWWRDQPGIVTNVFDDGRVVIQAQHIAAFDTTCAWMDDDERRNEAQEDNSSVVDSILSDSIWWFRD